jgi:hypothetical protein
MINTAICLLLLGWTLLPEPVRGWLFLPLWALAVALVFSGSIEAARLRRRAWLGQYLQAGSPWNHLLRGGVLMVSRHLLLALVLANLMLVKLLIMNPWLWLVLLLNLPLLDGLTAGVRARLQRHAKPEVVRPLARRIIVPVNVSLLLLVYLLLSLNLSQPNLVGQSWLGAMSGNLPASSASGTLPGMLMHFQQTLELTAQWALQNTMGGQGSGSFLGLLGWSLFFLTSGTFLWAWVRLLVGAEALRERNR